jgi:membrane protein DedA with SNARE-associated domain
LLDQSQIVGLLATYGYWLIFLVVALESAGVPMPGETILVGAAIYAGQSGAMSIELIIFAAASGAIIGDNIGFWIGREYGTKFLERYGPSFGVGPEKLRLGKYLFKKYGGLIVFAGRFVALLRILAAVLAGANHYDPLRFFLFNASGGIVWALFFGLGAYYLSVNFQKIEGPFATTAAIAALIGVVALWRYYKINESRLMQEADAALAPPPDARGEKPAP